MSVTAESTDPMSRDLWGQHQAVLSSLLDAVGTVLRGKEAVATDVLTAILAGGHILLEDVPGVGKTTLGQAFAQVLGCTFRRIQFTSDLLPSDIIGVNIFVPETGEFEFRAGPIFANVVLADEINRTTPKTQSSLLEAMNEGQVSMDNATRPLPKPFIVIATQNPQDFHGTYPLPESQLDRFMVRLHNGYPDGEVERDILQTRTARHPVEDVEAKTDLGELLAMQAIVDQVRVDPLILDYLMTVVEATRQAQDLTLGVSTRGALELQRACRARALICGRDYVLPDDVKHLAIPVLAHRVQLPGHWDSLNRGHDRAETIIAQIVDEVPVPV
jgi:MoxR-like ATPase